MSVRRRIIPRGALVAALVILVGVGLTYVLPGYRLFAFGQFLAYLAAVAGLSVLIGLSGQLSIGHAGLMAAGGYTMAVTQNALYDAGFTVPAPAGPSERFAAAATPSAAPWTLAVSLLAGVAAALIVGTALALATVRLRGPYLAGLTLAFGLVVVPVATLLGPLHGEQGLRVQVPRAPAALTSVGEARWRVWMALLAVAVLLVALDAVVRGRLGRDLRAVRDDEVAAALVGIRVGRARVVGFTLSAAPAGLGGGLYVYLAGTVLPGYFSLILSLYLVLAVVVGGAGSLAGSAWGTLFVVAVPILTADVVRAATVDPARAARLAGNAPLVLFGLTLVVVTIAARDGIQGLLRRAVRRIREWAVDHREDGVRNP
jgi:branched-chain amino acid transport system permease protein